MTSYGDSSAHAHTFVYVNPISIQVKMATQKADYSCSGCLELFSEPKVLPCCHTFCLKCLQKTARSAQKKGEITCPQCRKTHAIPAGGLAEFLTDFIIAHEVEVANLKSPTSRAAKSALICGECEEPGPVESYCSDCQNYLCRDCILAHKKFKAYRGHKVTPIRELDAAGLSCQVQYCAEHTSEAVKLYCATCQKLICRDCTLVEHRQHSYTFTHDARKKIDDEMATLAQTVHHKLGVFQANLGEMCKVESSVDTYTEKLKGKVYTFFDKLIKSIEARRTLLLTQAEVERKEDLKQIRADKVFHKTTISQISAVFGLVNKARQCTSDEEMILTALQSIRQLSQLKETEWDDSAFTTLLSTQPTFTSNLKQEAHEIGVLARPARDELIVPPIPKSATLGSSLVFQVFNKKKLIDWRSDERVRLQYTKNRDLGVKVTYGQSQKKLEHVTVETIVDGNSEVAIQLVCGGKHVIAITIGNEPAPGSPFTLTVKGVPKNGDKVTKGPDWALNPSQGNLGYVESGVVNSLYEHSGGPFSMGGGLQLGGLMKGGLGLGATVAAAGQRDQTSDDQRKENVQYTVQVYWNTGRCYNHTWGKDRYDIELIPKGMQEDLGAYDGAAVSGMQPFKKSSRR